MRPHPHARMALSPRVLLAVGVGNALEFYAFTTFAYFAVQIGHSFFPPDSPHKLLYALATFGVGFLTRPLGAYLFGRYADKMGRTAAMLAALSLMGLGTLAIALTPGYGRIGAAAPVLLVGFRLLQGFAVGGEVGPSTAYLMESAPSQRRGLYVALQLASQYAAGMAAGVVGFVLSGMLPEAQLQAWGWRIALLLGITVVPAGLYIRRRLPDTSYRGAPLTEERHVGAALLARYVIVVAACTTCVYVIDYLNTYTQDTLKLGARLGFGVTIVESLTVMVAAPLGGALSDRFGRKPVILGAIALLVVVLVPAYWTMMAWHKATVVYAMSAILACLEALLGTAAMVMIVESVPRARRAAVFGVLYAVVVAVFGGFAQFVVHLLIETTGSGLAPGAYLVLVLIVGAAAMLGVRETAPSRHLSSRRATSTGSNFQYEPD